MWKIVVSIALLMVIICLFGLPFPVEQLEEDDGGFLAGTSPVGTVITEEQLKKDVLIIAENCNVLPYTNTYDVYENNGNTSFAFSKEDGYQKGGVLLISV